MNWLGEQLLGYGKVMKPAQVKRRLHEVTAGEIRAVAGDFLRPERFNLALVSPLANGRTVARLLDANAEQATLNRDDAAVSGKRAHPRRCCPAASL